MVCPRCIQAVRAICDDMELNVADIQLGELIIKQELDEKQKVLFKSKLENVGFELLDDAKKQIIEKVKTLLISHIQHSSEEIHINYSNYLSEEIGKDYRYLSTLFSTYTGMTIEKFIIQLKIEKIKEYIF
mgnify:CR=1 FL=1